MATSLSHCIFSVYCCRSFSANFESHEWRECLARPSLPYVLQILTGLCQNHHSTQVRPGTMANALLLFASTTSYHTPLRLPSVMGSLTLTIFPPRFIPSLMCTILPSPHLPSLLPSHSASWLMSPHSCMCWSRSPPQSTLAQ